MKEMNRTLEKVRALRPIDDIMFQKLAESEKVCQEILRVILEDDRLIVNHVISQASLGNIFGRAVRLDALCTLGDGTLCNIEVQKENTDDDLKRSRYNAAGIVSHFSDKGSLFSQTPNVIVVYISQYDVFAQGRTIYHVDSVIRETNTAVDDGLSRIFVNTRYCDTDKSDIGELMNCFLQTEIASLKFPELAGRLSYFKNNQKGVHTMCKIIDDYAHEIADERSAEDLVKYIETLSETAGSIDNACSLLKVTRRQYDDAKALLEKSLTV
ncbi:MAG: PD-(D/E)XK nuclease family transposase [Lachnospira sp.]|nr:PD-(D/E)XK nuclease family transposase [Lachnospira sp.]